MPRQPVLRLAQRAAAFHGTPLARDAGPFRHENTAGNLAETPFEFDEDSERDIAFTLAKYPDTAQGKQSAIMPMLWIVQKQLDAAHATINAKTADPGAIPFPKSQGGGPKSRWEPVKHKHIGES